MYTTRIIFNYVVVFWCFQGCGCRLTSDFASSFHLLCTGCTPCDSKNINDFPSTGLNTERKTEKIALGLSLHSSKKLGKLPNWQKKLEFHIARTD
jgi:hypothetical protein